MTFRGMLKSVLAPLRDVASMELDALRVQVGRAESARVRGALFEDPRHAEFKVFSQWGEDGILQYLISKVPIQRTEFIEFGVESYAESNTRFLLINDNWRGLIIDGGRRHVGFVERTGLVWRHDVTAVTAFITRENVDDVFGDAGFRGDIGLLSVDIDGNDYWVWEAVSAVSPRIVAVEYNSVFGPDRAVSTPYDPMFTRSRHHWTNLCYGASLAALHQLGLKKGYVLVAGNSAGNNAFFVRKDCASGLRARTPAEVWVQSRFREARGKDGRLSLLSSREERLRAMADALVVDVESGEINSVGSMFGV